MGRRSARRRSRRRSSEGLVGWRRRGSPAAMETQTHRRRYKERQDGFEFGLGFFFQTFVAILLNTFIISRAPECKILCTQTPTPTEADSLNGMKKRMDLFSFFRGSSLAGHGQTSHPSVFYHCSSCTQDAEGAGANPRQGLHPGQVAGSSPGHKQASAHAFTPADSEVLS